MNAHLLTIARLECVSVSRFKWIRLLAAAFGLMTIAAAYAAGAANDLTGADNFTRTTMTLIPVVVILVPLAALVLGVSGQAAEAGNEAFLFSQPVRRAEVVLGRWMGECAALGGAIALGLSGGGALIALTNGWSGAASFVFFVAASVSLAAIFVSIAAAVASATDTRMVALGVSVFIWFVFVLLYDAAVLSVATWMPGPRGGRVLFGSVFGNPADLVRIAMLSVSGTPNVLGAAGEAWTRFLGGRTVAAAAMVAALTAWTIAPIAFATAVMGRRDL